MGSAAEVLLAPGVHLMRRLKLPAKLGVVILRIDERSGLLLDRDTLNFSPMSLTVQRSLPWIDQLSRLYAHGISAIAGERAIDLARTALAHTSPRSPGAMCKWSIPLLSLWWGCAIGPRN